MPFALLLLLLFGCTEGEVTPEDRLASAQAYDSLRRELPDALGDDASAIDSLFVAYGEEHITPHDTAGAAAWVDSMMSALTLREQVGQLFIIHADERRYAGIIDRAVDAARDYGVGGFLVPRLLSPEEVFERSRQLQRAARVPLFIAADYERGVGRFNNAFTELPSNMAIGATCDTVFAAAAGRLTAIEARALGVNLLFAPVVDVNNNPANPIINIRSYGGDPQLVGRMAEAFVREAETHGLLTTLKHFPGHGDTDVDTHSRMGTVRGDRESLERVELRPYRIVLEAPPQPTAVMSAHLWITALEPDPLPATFSSRLLTDLLREEMGFRGIVITDDIRMGALQTQYAVEDRILRPLQAGANVILTPANLAQAIEIVMSAVESDRLSRAQVEQSARRVLEAKASAGLHRERLPSEERFERLSERPLGAYIAQAIADRSITLLKTAPELPLRPDTQDVRVVHLTNYQDAESIEAAIDRFNELLDLEDSRQFDDDPPQSAVTRIVEDAAEADAVVVAMYLRLQAGRGEAGLLPRQTELVEQLLALDTPIVLVTFGNPYAATAFQNAKAIVVAYDQSLETIYATTRVLQGRQPALGRLPITVDPFGFGAGMNWVDDRPQEVTG